MNLLSSLDQYCYKRDRYYQERLRFYGCFMLLAAILAGLTSAVDYFWPHCPVVSQIVLFTRLPLDVALRL